MSERNLQIGFVGGGNMARAMVAGLLRAGHEPACIAIAEPATAARESLAALHPQLQVTDASASAAVGAGVLVLAVKPQVIPAVLGELAGLRRPPGQLLVSVAAGITLATLQRGVAPGGAAVRIMPNQPALVGAGMSVLVAAVGVGAAQRAQAQYIAAATGQALWVNDESLMDAVTAVSGSGPAYFYLLMEAMEEAAVALGLPMETARTLVRQTALGAAGVAVATGGGLAPLRDSVTSPGGTTAAALAVLDAAGWREALKRAITAARDRGAELGSATR
ncbi:MAG: pyrroline-5-carboxylate reductase [Gammaproteobacteria bacterium]|nr:MAG: pyrroline-5-carboxylate reductase [Gammaproteobacteria bacterium]